MTRLKSVIGTCLFVFATGCESSALLEYSRDYERIPGMLGERLAWAQITNATAAEVSSKVNDLAPKIANGGTELKAELASTLAHSGITSTVAFASRPKDGAVVKYKLIIGSEATVPGTTNDCPPNNCRVCVPIGIYNFWSERNGKPTSSVTAEYAVIQRFLHIVLVERTAK